MLIQRGELRNHKGDEEGHHHDQHDHQQSGIDQRSRQLLAKTHRQALERDIAAHHLFQVAALLTCQQCGGVHLGKNFLRLERIGEQLATAHPVVHILQHGTEEEIALPLDQQLQRLDDRQAGMDQGHELLVEDDKLLLLDLAPPREPDLGRKQALGLDRIDQKALLSKAVADLDLRAPILGLLEDVAPFVGHLDQVFGHG